MKKNKRLLAMILAAVFLVGVLPAYAIGAEADEDETVAGAVEVSASAEVPDNDAEEPEPTETPELTDSAEPDVYPEASEIPTISDDPIIGIDSVESAEAASADEPEIMPIANNPGTGTAVLTFKWNNTQYEIKRGSDTAGAGVSWTCDNDGNFTITFTQSGNFQLVSGKVTAASATVIGGGGGGDSAYIVDDYYANLPYYNGRGVGGNGGAAGKKATGNVLSQFTAGNTVKVVVGAGGAGGDNDDSFHLDAYDSGNTDGLEQAKGANGGSSSFGSLTAAGGAGGGGGAGGTNGLVTGGDPNGKNGPNAGDGGGGGGVGLMRDPGYGPLCFICNGSGTSPYHGGTGNAGGGNGGSPANDHSSTDHHYSSGIQHGQNGTDGTGGGGGGGGFSTRMFVVDSVRWDDDDWMFNWSPGMGSAKFGGWGGDGGRGGSGLVTVTGKVSIGIQMEFSKTSSLPNLSNGNGCYSLKGAVYGIYSDAACKTLMEKITTDDNGYAKTTSLYAPGTYYLKEITASPGYLLDPNTYILKVDSAGNVTKEM